MVHQLMKKVPKVGGLITQLNVINISLFFTRKKEVKQLILPSYHGV